MRAVLVGAVLAALLNCLAVEMGQLQQVDPNLAPGSLRAFYSLRKALANQPDAPYPDCPLPGLDLYWDGGFLYYYDDRGIDIDSTLQALEPRQPQRLSMALTSFGADGHSR